MSSSSTTFQQQPRLLISPDGKRGANVHLLDAPNPLYAGWADMTDLDDDALHRVVADRQMAALAAAEA